MLRERIGLPRIGEGWVSEMRLYRLVKAHFPDAQHQASPTWLRPQRFDVYIPSHRIAFEYQGRQHFEPIDFFGGEEGLETTRRRDQKKKDQCKAHWVKLIYWRYDESIEEAALLHKLYDVGLRLD